jgi:hypothetical protein
MLKIILSFTLLILYLTVVKAQLVINEASNRNFTQLLDEDGDNNDWIELYNSSSNKIILNNWALSDSRSDLVKWPFGLTEIEPKSFLVVHASGKNRTQQAAFLQWRSVILADDIFRYLIPIASTPNTWMQPAFNDQNWSTGKGGFGFGDGDDQTIISQENTVLYLRKSFNIQHKEDILSGKLFVDYDDGFVAWLNGVEIARSNVSGQPQWNSVATQNHEAVMYTGGIPEMFEINTLQDILVDGENLLAIAALNVSNTSSDFTIMPWLLFGMIETNNQFRALPSWFKQPVPGGIHANFKLSSQGENIFLSYQGIVRDSFRVERTQVNHSTGRITDGGEVIGLFAVATPGSSNQTSAGYEQGYADAPRMNIPAGFYTSTVNISLSSPEPNVVIRYTLDGNEPNESSSLFTSDIRIQSTKSLRARSYVTGKLPSDIATSTYFINDTYSIPVLSVNANHADVFGPGGIFTRWEQTFDVPSYVEYFEKDQLLVFRQFTGMQVDGGAGGSRHLPQHSFRIEPGNGALGDGDAKHKLMHRRPNRDNFPSFYIRNGSNQHLKLFYKDGLQVTALGRNTYTYYSAYHPLAVYINGNFFGIYEFREKINDDYLVDNYGMNIDSLDFLGVSYFKGQQLEALRGSIEPFLNDYRNFIQLNPSSNNFMETVESFLDIQSYTDYIIAESWVGNNDWPFNNIKLFRCKSTGFKWRWAINDLEWALNPNGWTSSSFDHIQYMNNQSTGNYYTAFWFNMMKNPDYKAYFVNRFADLMNTNYHFSQIGPLENEFFNEVFPEMEHQYSRWGSGNVNSQLNNFSSFHQIFREELSKRSDFVRTHLINHFNLRRTVNVVLNVDPPEAGAIQISTVVPSKYPWEGIYFQRVEVEVTALPNLGYSFDRWDGNEFIDDVLNASVIGIFNTDNVVFKAYFKPVDELNAGVVISEINYKQGVELESPDWLEISNFSNDEINLKDWYFRDADTSRQFLFERDYLLRPNERMVISNNFSRFYGLYPDVPAYLGEFDFGLGTPSDEIHLYNPNDELIFSVAYSDLYPWPLSEDHSGRTLELRNPGGNVNEPLAWMRGCIGGSPGSAFNLCNEQSVSVEEPAIGADLQLQAYPNPASDVLRVAFSLDEAVSFCTFSLYDLSGNKLKSMNAGNLQSGNHIYSIGLNGIPGQILLLKMNTNQGTQQLKVIKLND